MATGTVKWFNDAKGFITPEDGSVRTGGRRGPISMSAAFR
jgi:hypothetical protein